MAHEIHEMGEKKEPFLEHTDNIIFFWLELVLG